MPLIQLSSGRGPAECELAVGLYAEYLLRRKPGAEIVKSCGRQEIKLSGRQVCLYQSLLIRLPDQETITEGTILWKSKSPFRPNHGRKNWFFLVGSVADETDFQDESFNLKSDFRKDELSFETFRSPGKGGQNVNKVETGVRVKHLPTGLTACSVTARTQGENKRLALERLVSKFKTAKKEHVDALKLSQRRRHDQLIRGSPVQTFSGLDFCAT
ncbi:MAG: peptide chain release factor-like protein [Deltaproteobacteria bacterium]|nr:peptide chain release factor-like protein [Deltaproteobacteria bacterium]